MLKNFQQLIVRAKFFFALSLFLLQTLVLAAPPYPTFSLGEEYIGEEQGKGWVEGSGQPIRYASAEESELYKLTFKEGKIYNSSGTLFDTQGWSGIYVMTRDGDFYATSQQRAGRFHHSSLVGGLPVAGAGDLIVSKGVIQRINNRSGHYRTPPEAMKNVLEQLKTNGIEPEVIDVLEHQPKLERTAMRKCKTILSQLLVLKPW